MPPRRYYAMQHFDAAAVAAASLPHAYRHAAIIVAAAMMPAALPR